MRRPIPYLFLFVFYFIIFFQGTIPEIGWGMILGKMGREEEGLRGRRGVRGVWRGNESRGDRMKKLGDGGEGKRREIKREGGKGWGGGINRFLRAYIKGIGLLKEMEK